MGIESPTGRRTMTGLYSRAPKTSDLGGGQSIFALTPNADIGFTRIADKGSRPRRAPFAGETYIGFDNERTTNCLRHRDAHGTPPSCLSAAGGSANLEFRRGPVVYTRRCWPIMLKLRCICISSSLRCSTSSDNCDTLGLSVICRSLKVHYDSEARRVLSRSLLTEI
jgi:hypothetical protein